MKRSTSVVIIVLLFATIGSTGANAQEEKKEQLWYCIEETVKPDRWEQYVKLSKEIIDICKENGFSFPFYTWNGRPLVYELWTPIESLNNIEKIEKEWKRIVDVWGAENYAAFNATKLSNYSKTTTVRNDMAYSPENPVYSIGDPLYCRWIEVYLKSGSEKEFEEIIAWMNDQRNKHDYRIICRFAEGGIGYDTPSYIGLYGHDSMAKYMEYHISISDTYKKDFEEYLSKIRQLMVRPPKIFDNDLLWELSFNPVGQ
jgi:hypothetical protein